jgi:hypothetical protein
VTAVDRWLFGPGTGRALVGVRTGLAAIIGVRIALGPYRELAGQPSALFRPPPLLSWLPSMPPLWVLVALQLVGFGAAVAAVAGRRVAVAFPLAWVSLLVLAGCKDSLGKVLHNDVLLLLAAVPFLLAPADARWDDRTPSRRYGWPVRTAMVIVAGAYFATGVQKLVHSGLAWVTGDNMRWILYSAASSGRAPTRDVALYLADRPWLAHVAAAGLLGIELLFPIVLVVRRARPFFIVAVAALHIGTWLTLGLDYWGWALTVAVVLWDWDRRVSAQVSPVSTSMS